VLKKPREATLTANKMQSYTIFFIILIALHVSYGFSAHHKELKNFTHSIWYVPGLLAATASKNYTFLQNVQTESRTHVVSILGVLPPSLKRPEREVENSTSVKRRGSEFVDLELCSPEMPSRHALGRIYTTTFPLYPSIAANFPLRIFY
jgi:hypothetical protein